MLATSSCRRIMKTKRFSTSLAVSNPTSRNKREKPVRYVSQLSRTSINERTLRSVVGPSSVRVKLHSGFWIRAKSAAADFGQLPQVWSRGEQMVEGHHISIVSANTTRRLRRSRAEEGANLAAKMLPRRKSLPQATVSNTVVAITRRWRKDTTA